MAVINQEITTMPKFKDFVAFFGILILFTLVFVVLLGGTTIFTTAYWIILIPLAFCARYMIKYGTKDS